LKIPYSARSITFLSFPEIAQDCQDRAIIKIKETTRREKEQQTKNFYEASENRYY